MEEKVVHSDRELSVLLQVSQCKAPYGSLDSNVMLCVCVCVG